jgi:hypothetical protein
MIRIDEIYNNTFWPWVRDHIPGTRVYFCDPPGHTGTEHLFNLGSDDIVENNYVFMHDQEPVHLDTFEPLFIEVMLRNWDLTAQLITVGLLADDRITWPDPQFKIDFQTWRKNTPDSVVGPTEFFKKHYDSVIELKKANAQYFVNVGHVVVSERGEFVEQLCEKYQWIPHYYFYHGWACLDWFRGYDRSFLIARARDRSPTRTFISPNRIVGGKRDHRVLFLYNVFKNGLEHNHISAPRICSQENVDITSIAQKYTNVYQDITNVFDQAGLPRTFAGEDTQTMASCWLTNFDEAADSLVYVPTETVFFGRRLHITEKTFKAIALEMPFVLVAPAGSLEYMREYGFQTFGSIFDESYDTETDDIRRIEKVTRLLKELDSLTVRERQAIHRACLPIVEHNYNHFYGGGLADILWTELVTMLNNLEKKTS